MKKALISFTILFLLAVFSATAMAGDYKIIANPSVGVDSISGADVKGIYLGKKSTWGDGSKVVFFMSKSDATDSFLKVVGKSSSQFKSYWKKQVFTGKGSMPKSFDSDAATVSAVAGSPGAISYVSATADTAGVKVISIQ